MKKFLIECLIATIIIFITRKISDSYIIGGVTGILVAYVYEAINRLEKTLIENDYFKIKEETKKLERKNKALQKLLKLANKYDLKLTRAELGNKKVIVVSGIIEEKMSNMDKN